jgi:hypothetical protein
MLQFLLDVHVPPAVAGTLGHGALHLRDWESGRWLNAPDPQILDAVLQAGLTIVTFDVHTFPTPLLERTAAGLDNPGVVFVNRRTLAQNDVGGLAKALDRLWQAEHKANWLNRCWFLRAG